MKTIGLQVSEKISPNPKVTIQSLYSRDRQFLHPPLERFFTNTHPIPSAPCLSLS